MVIQWDGIYTIRQRKSQMHDCCPSRKSWSDQGNHRSTGGTGTRLRRRLLTWVSERKHSRNDHHKQRYRDRTVHSLAGSVTVMKEPRSLKQEEKLGDGQINLCLVMDRSFSSCEWKIWLEHPGQSLGSLSLNYGWVNEDSRGHTAGPTWLRYTGTGPCIIAIHELPLWNLYSSE